LTAVGCVFSIPGAPWIAGRDFMGTVLHLVKTALALLLTSGTQQLEAPAPDHGNREVIVRLDSQAAIFLEDGTEANLVQVSTGRSGFATPTGEYSVLYRRRAPVSSTYMVRMPWWICIEGSGQIGMHQAARSAERRLGTVNSHGCIRLGRFTAWWAYRWLPVGARVSVVRGDP
jgi:lipoprotein-anchoring transpeptidase ErfK/SrfK